MSEHKYASWVKGIYLQLAKDEEYSYQDFYESSLYRFFTRSDSKDKIKTLHAIAQAESDSVLAPPLLELQALDILRLLLNQIEHHHSRYGSIRKKELTRSLKQFRKATINLFNTLNCTHSYHSFDLIKDAPAMWVGKSMTNMDEHEIALTKALKSFWEKSAPQVLLEYADEIELLGTGNPHFLVNNREPTTTQVKIRLAMYLIIAMIGIEAAKEIEEVGALIAHIVSLTLPEHECLEVGGVNKQIKTAIKLCETHGLPITFQ